LGRFTEAIQLFDQARELDSEQAGFNVESNRGAALIAAGELEQGRAALRSALLRWKQSGESDTGKAAVVRNLLLRSKKVDEWQHTIRELVSAFADEQSLAHLGQGLVSSIATLQNDDIVPPIPQDWLRVWGEIAGDLKELELPLRLLGAAVGFLKARDERALLTLAVEERRIVQELLRAGSSV
jgi:hypothetical protein